MLTQLLKKAGDAIKSTITDANKSPFQQRVEEFGNSHWNDLKSAYITYHQIVWDALLKYAGVLWIQWNNQTKTYEITATEDEWTPTPEINRFSPAIDAMMSNFSVVPEIEAVPKATTDMSAYAISDIVTKLCQHVMKTNALHADFKGDEDKPGRAGALLTIAGTVFTHTFPVEEQIGTKPVMAPGPGYGVRCPACDQFKEISADQVEDPTLLDQCPKCGGPTEVNQAQVMQESGEVEPVMKHSVKVTIGNPLYMLPRPGAKFMGELNYMFWAERISIDEVWNRWQYEAQADQVYTDGYSTSYENTLQYFYTGSASSTIRTKEECMVVQMLIEPGKVKAIPEGCYAVMVNGQWIHVEEWPFIEHPVTKANYKNQPMLFFGRTDSFDLAKLQKESNHYEAIIKLHAMTSSMDPIIQDENTQTTEITNRGDRVIKYRSIGPGGSKPERLQHGSLDNGVYVQRDKIASEFQNVSGAVNVWRGQAPGSVTAASAISQLRGQAEQMFATPEGNWNALWVETVRKAVVILQQTMEPWELEEIVGKGKDIEIQTFKTIDLTTAIDFLSTKSGLPRTRDERRQEMLTLWDHKALDPNDPNVKEKMVELFGETGMMQQFNLDATRARMENEQIKNGTMTEPRPMVGIEDLGVHFSIHAEAIKALDFDKWDQKAKEVMFHHALETKEAFMMEQGLMADPNAEGPDDPNAPPDPAGGKGVPSKDGAGAVAGPSAARTGTGGGKNARKRGKASPVPASNNRPPQVPTGPNGPGADKIPGGNR